MADFSLFLGETKTLNYVLPNINITFSNVFFVFGDGKGYKKTIKCIPQSITSPTFKRWSEGGLAIPLKKEECRKSGSFNVQFQIVDRKGNVKIYPETGYMTLEIKQTL